MSHRRGASNVSGKPLHNSSNDVRMAKKEKQRQKYIDIEYNRRDATLTLTRALEDLKATQKALAAVQARSQERDQELEKMRKPQEDLGSNLSANKELAEKAAQLEKELKELRKDHEDHLERMNQEFAEKTAQLKDRADSLQRRTQIAETSLQDLRKQDQDLQAKLADIKKKFRELVQNEELIQKEVEAQRRRNEMQAQDLPPSTHMTVPQSMAIGLPNVGNTCYLNAVLQCLVHTPGVLRQSWLQAGEGDTSFHIMTSKLRALLEGYRSKSPTLRIELQDLLDTLSPAIEIGVQEDAVELLDTLLEGLKKTMQWVEAAFTLTIEVMHSCMHNDCKEVCSKESKDHVLRLSLITSTTTAGEVDALEEVSVQELIDSHMSTEEVLFGECQHCGRKAQLSRKETLSSSGDILVVQLHRFDGGCTPKGGYHTMKVMRRIQLQPHITLSKGPGQARSGEMYELHGIVSHKGTELWRGHYVAVVKDLVSKQWIHCNDSSVSPAQVDRGVPVIDPEDDPYLLFYHRVECLSPR